MGGASAQSSTLDFGKASHEEYLPCLGLPLDVLDLLRAYEKEGNTTGVGIYFNRRKIDAEVI